MTESSDMEEREAFLKASLEACAKRTIKDELPPNIERRLLERMRRDFDQIAQRHNSIDGAKREFLKSYGVTQQVSGDDLTSAARKSGVGSGE